MNQKNYTGYPDLFCSKEKKATKEYGIQYFNAMYSDWVGESSNLLDIRSRRIRENRRYSAGMQAVDKYKQMFSDQTGDLSYTSIDWSIVPIIPKFVDVVVNGVINQDHKIVATAIDRDAVEERYSAKKETKAKMILKEFNEDFGKMTGMDMSSYTENLPDSDEELELYMDLNYKQAAEISMEEGVDFVFSYNDFDEIKKRVIRDLVDLNEGSLKVDVDGGLVNVRYVDPMNLVRSYSNDPANKDIYHVGEVREMTIGELRAAVKEEVPSDVWHEIASKHIGKLGNPNKIGRRPIFYEMSNSYEHDNFKVSVLDAEFLATNFDIYEKKETKYGTYTFTRKPDNYEPPKNPRLKREVNKDTYQVWYTGKWIVGSEHCFDYGVRENMVRPHQDKFKANSSYTVYQISPVDGISKSLTERMIPFADQIQLAHLKLAQHMGKARPKGMAFNLDALENVMKGDGGTFTPLEIQDVLQQTGNLYFRNVQDDGVTPSGNPFQELQGGVGSALQEFMLVYNYNLERIRDVTGLNEMRDGTKPSKDSLVGIQKLAVKASNNATRHIDDAFAYLMKSSASNVCLYMQHVIKYKDAYDYMYDTLISAIGRISTDAIDVIDNVPLRHFGIFLEVAPDEVEKQFLEQAIQISLQTQSIELEDATEIRRIKNIKLAERKLKVVREKRRKAKQEEAQQNSQMNAQIQQQSAQATAQMEAQIEQMKTKLESEKMQMEYQLKMQMSELEHKQKMEQLNKVGEDKDRHIELASNDQDSDLTRVRKF